MDDFDYGLPEAAVAQDPAEPRDAARLLFAPAEGSPRHHTVRDLPDLLQPGDLVVVNNTRVIPARLPLRKTTGGRAEVLLLEPLAGGGWSSLVRPGRRLPEGSTLVSERDPRLRVMVGEAFDDGRRCVRLWLGDEEICSVDAATALADAGEMPLPPYITTSTAAPDRYQTVYSERPGSVAAPTAGLHLTPEVLEGLTERGVGFATVELVVGLDTFRPVMVDDSDDHTMHSERYEVSPETLARCRDARRVVAVGTTTVRALESAVRGKLSGRTELFLQRGARFDVVDVMLTNFHLPRSTLLLMIDAFVGSTWRDLYQLALEEGYRFLSFGDAMLLERRSVG